MCEYAIEKLSFSFSFFLHHSSCKLFKRNAFVCVHLFSLALRKSKANLRVIIKPHCFRWVGNGHYNRAELGKFRRAAVSDDGQWSAQYWAFKIPKTILLMFVCCMCSSLQNVIWNRATHYSYWSIFNTPVNKPHTPPSTYSVQRKLLNVTVNY